KRQALQVAHVHTFPKVITLDYLKQQSALSDMPLVQKGSRLSVMPVTAEQWAVVMGLL
ncbi:EVE domain-containing protein, partial [Pseudomonas sp. CCC2.2]|uniref:EVE domain-containing protein n=1 Tax=Pseudomonas sp. CCC2.2 TaxID=3048605 RepID=UPI002B22900D